MGNGVSDRTEKIKRLVGCFEAGELDAAESLARELVASDRHDELALHLLAQTVFKQKKPGQAEEAVDLMKAVLDIDPANVSYNNDYGVMLASLGRWNEAATAYGMAATLDRNDFDARFNLALALLRTGQTERARAELDQVLAQWPDLPDALVLEGELLRAEGETTKALEAFRKAIGYGLETPNVYANLGLALEKLGRNEEALEAVQTAERLGGGDAESSFLLGNFYREKGDKAAAERHYRQALDLCPDFVEAYNNLGLLLLKNDPWQAGECFARALVGNPRFVAAYVNLAALRVDDGRVDRAIDSLKCALKIDPRSTAAWHGLASVYGRVHRLDESEEAFRHTLEIQPDSTEADFALGLLLLLRGRFSEGWPRYESRWLQPNRERRPPFEAPEWSGDDLGERTLLVYSEQGYGDNLQFARYLPLLHRRYPRARIHYWCPQSLLRLFESHATAWGVGILSKTAEPPPFDAHLALLSLPWKMGTELENIPADIPYLVPSPELSAKWAARLEPLSGRKVGLVWSGSESYAAQKFRAIHLKQLAPLFEIGGIYWVSLQKGNDAGQIAEEGLTGRILDVMDEVEDFADTAAIVANLDLVISVDTSVLHLAGALGKPAWLLNRFDTDWRWLLDREDSPWYPTLRIFRQTSLGGWDSVLPRVEEALADWVRAGGGDPAVALDVPEALAVKPAHEASALEKQVFGGERLSYRIVHARHGWMLVNPNDVYVGRALLEYGEYSEIESGFLHHYLFKPGRIVEVGANVGAHTVGLAKAAEAKGEEMVVFEPQPVVFQNLCANLALNGLRNVRAWPFACGDETEILHFDEPDYDRHGNFGGVSMSRAEDGVGRVAVPCVRLDDFLGEGAVALIKIDVEGYEFAVLRGADETLRRWRPVLYVENDRVDESKALIEWLWSRGYRLFWHLPPLFNPDNFFGKSANGYGRIVSVNMICMPAEFIQGELRGLNEIVDSSKHPLLENDRRDAPTGDLPNREAGGREEARPCDGVGHSGVRASQGSVKK
ncbi:MAG: FkbM family methyltransferase [Candidatus Accumulibacter sp.]|jgi:FkbM family methyltransferase|nr:FkbM family methyltransferase [Accumulibacter sp.]